MKEPWRKSLGKLILEAASVQVLKSEEKRAE
jgi:hypothetical protein